MTYLPSILLGDAGCVLWNPGDSSELSAVRLDLQSALNLNGMGDEFSNAFADTLFNVAETIVLIDKEDIGFAADLDGGNVLGGRVLIRLVRRR